MSRVYIVLLNWNNWPDTLECLESLLRLEYPDFQIVVCDNGSTDNSLERLKSWSAGQLGILPADMTCKDYPKPQARSLRVVEYDRATAEAGGHQGDEAELVVIRNDANLGFAGGNNVGLRYLLARGDADYAWVLNNDTVVDPGALKALVACLQSQPTAGICGSSLLNYWNPHRVDALGGAYYCNWLGLAWHLGRCRRLPNRVDPDRVLRHMDYVVGSSMFVSTRFLREVGLMEESFFLYYEELDWAMRARGRFDMAWAPDSLVYHKIGGSIGTSSHPARKSLTSDFYTLRNRIRFTRQHCPWALPTIYFGLSCAVVLRLVFGQWRRARMVTRLMMNPGVSFEKACQG